MSGRKRYSVGLLAALVMSMVLAVPVVSLADELDEGTPGYLTICEGEETGSSNVDTLYINGTYNYSNARETLRLVNAERSKRGLSNLTLDAELTEAAMLRAVELSVFFSHTRPNGEVCFSVSPAAAAENIAAGQSSPAEAMSSWMNSDGHRSNILGPSFESVGIGCVTVNGTTFWVQIFGGESTSACKETQTKTLDTAVRIDDDTVFILSGGFYLGDVEATDEEAIPVSTGSSIRMKPYLYLITENGGSWVQIAAKTFSWESSDISLATVSNGGALKVQQIAGRFTITATTTGGYGVALDFCAEPFADVRSKTPHYEDVIWLYNAGITTGFVSSSGVRTFQPYSNVARCDMAAFLYRLAGSPDFTPTSAQKRYFSDVNSSTPHCNEIWWLAAQGISTGWDGPNGTHEFRPYANVARCDMAAFLYRLAGSPSYTPTAAERKYFSDIDASSPHALEVWWLASTGVSKGWDEKGGTHSFRPYNNVARCDMAAFLHRMANNKLVKKYG